MKTILMLGLSLCVQHRLLAQPDLIDNLCDLVIQHSLITLVHHHPMLTVQFQISILPHHTCKVMC